jgi:hypothetical protein
MFSANDIQARVKRQPFEPLRIITNSGEYYDIYHPDLIMVGVRNITVGTASEKNPTMYDRSAYLSLLHITAMENLPTPAATKGPDKNGQ